MKVSLILIACLILKFVSAQTGNESIYIFDAAWKPEAKIKNAVYMLRVLKTEDDLWQWDYYNFLGPLIKTETFKDKDAKIRHGMFAYYSPSGSVDSTGHYFEGNRDKTWYYWNPQGKIIMTKDYDKGDLLRERDTTEPDPDRAAKKIIDTLATKVEIESEYPGGPQAWLRYLNKNMQYPDRAVNANIKGKVIISFIVDITGGVTEPQVLKSVEYSLDDTALSLIKRSGHWTPAIQNGRQVKSYKRQPIIYMLDLGK